MTILKVENLKKSFGSTDVLRGIDINIDEKGIYALIGPNGAGKTTLFNIISNLLNPTSGNIEVVGKKNTDSNIFYEVSFLKDNRVLYDYLSGYDHLEFIKTAQKLPKERIDEVINMMQIKEYVNKKVGDYSLGMKQHLLIAMAMLNKPKLMILDEPLNGLDPTAVIKVRYLLKKLAKEGATILISSHTLSEIDLLTDKIMFLKDGKIVEEFVDKNKDNKYEIIVEEKSVEKLKQLNLSELDYDIDNNKLTVNLGDKSIDYLLSKLVQANIGIADILKKKVGSEERYMQMFPEEMDRIKELVN